MALPAERFEICYLLEPQTRARILPALLARLHPCPLGGPGGHQRVTSLYLGEAPAAGEAPARRRLRLRLHEAEARALRCVVEVKHRVGLRSSVRQAQVGLIQSQALVGGHPVDAGPAARPVLDEALELVRGGLRPSVVVACRRIALLGDEGSGDLRATIDSDITFRARDLTLRPSDARADGDVLAPGQSLLVVKVASAVPSWLTLLLGRSGLARSAGKHALAARAAALLGPSAARA